MPPDSRRLRGIALIIGAFSLFPLSDAAAKYLTDTMHALQITWVRTFCHMAIFAVVVLARHPRAILKSRRPGLQFWRGAAGYLSHVPFFAALAFIPLGDAFAAGLVGPLFVTALSMPLLGEHVGWRRWTAVAVGFAGAMIVVRPGLGLVHWATILPVFAALFFALFQIATRRLARHDHPEATLLIGTFWGLVLATIPLPWYWNAIAMEDLLYIAIMSGVSAAAHFCLAKAFQLAPASLLAPFAYLQLITAIGFGYWLFADVPDAFMLLGSALIAGSGLYVAFRERTLARRAGATE
jgi:drug/metabolite transporter (DMT)-like permease